MIRDSKGDVVDVSKPNQLQFLIGRGLRAQLGVIGLATGLLYVELDFLDPRENPVDTTLPSAKYPVVPAVLSTISEFQSSATEIMTKLKRVDFEGLANNLKSLLTDTRIQIDNLDLKDLGAQWRHTGASVEALVDSPEVKQTFANLNATLASLRSALADLHQTLGHVDSQVDANGKDLQATLLRTQQTLQQFDAAALTLRRFVGSQQNLGDDAHQALDHLSAAADAVERLADFLERNPNALISGRAR